MKCVRFSLNRSAGYFIINLHTPPSRLSRRMSFKFNFFNSTSDCTQYKNEFASEKASDGDKQSARCSKKMYLTEMDNKIPEDVKTVCYSFGDINVKVVDTQSVEIQLSSQACEQSEVVQAVSSHTDLVPGVYEGGLKVWECGLDLAEYLCHHCIDCEGKRVLELGCGAGIPGLCAIQKGAKAVDFQDYNSEAIEKLTMKNVLLNKKEDCKCNFFCGDWGSLVGVINPDEEKPCCYDIILTAETIYNIDNYAKLVQVFDHLLSPGGIIYLSAKSNYFGVGGGTRVFEEFLTSTDKFNSEVCHTIAANVPREILKIVRKKFPS